MDNILIARKYASSLIDLFNYDELQRIYQICDSIFSVYHVDRFRDILEMPNITKEKKLEFLLHVLDLKSEKDKRIINFLRLMTDNHRLSMMKYLLIEIGNHMNKEKNTYPALLTSSQVLSENELNEIKARLETKLGINLILDQDTDYVDGIKIVVLGLGIELSFCRDGLIKDLREYILRAI